MPLWLRFVFRPEGREAVGAEVPTRKLSSTWFGDPAGGELCYSLEAPLRRGADAVAPDESYAVCEVEVRNLSPEPLAFERICVHVESMRLFSSGGRLWTNEVQVAFKGADQVSQLSFLPKPPASVRSPELVCDHRTPPDNSLLKRSFNFLREITGF